MTTLDRQEIELLIERCFKLINEITNIKDVYPTNWNIIMKPGSKKWLGQAGTCTKDNRNNYLGIISKDKDGNFTLSTQLPFMGLSYSTIELKVMDSKSQIGDGKYLTFLGANNKPYAICADGTGKYYPYVGKKPIDDRFSPFGCEELIAYTLSDF